MSLALVFKEGEVGHNEYGPDPLGGHRGRGSFQNRMSTGMRETPGIFGPISDMFKGGVKNKFKGFYDKAFDSFSEGLSLREEIGFNHLIINSLNNFGYLYLMMSDFEKAKHFSKFVSKGRLYLQHGIQLHKIAPSHLCDYMVCGLVLHRAPFCVPNRSTTKGTTST